MTTSKESQVADGPVGAEERVNRFWIPILRKSLSGGREGNLLLQTAIAASSGALEAFPQETTSTSTSVDPRAIAASTLCRGSAVFSAFQITLGGSFGILRLVPTTLQMVGPSVTESCMRDEGRGTGMEWNGSSFSFFLTASADSS